MTRKPQDKTQHLVTRAKAGDESARNQLCEAYVERVRRIVRLRMGAELRSKLQSMDIVQDALMSALRDLDGFNYSTEGDFVSWLSGIAENQIRGNLDRLHAAKRDMRREVPLEQRLSSTGGQSGQAIYPVSQTTPSLIFTRKEDLDRLEQAMDQLKPAHRQVIILARIEGLAHKDIAARMGKSPDAVGMLLSRALLALTKAFLRDSNG
ncbi:MAG: sigma-70 family RNA polymerase sigma factor [Planctomycetota bacterium]|jgi:RNA polymerase sigma-70 factor (ECF subfamily)